MPKILEDWENEGPCRRITFASCSDAIQVQTRTCIDGTLDKCTDEERHRITTCKHAGTCSMFSHHDYQGFGENINHLCS